MESSFRWKIQDFFRFENQRKSEILCRLSDCSILLKIMHVLVSCICRYKCCNKEDKVSSSQPKVCHIHICKSQQKYFYLLFCRSIRTHSIVNMQNLHLKSQCFMQRDNNTNNINNIEYWKHTYLILWKMQRHKIDSKANAFRQWNWKRMQMKSVVEKTTMMVFLFVYIKRKIGNVMQNKNQ